ncbi:DUF1854 domain-containing protein [Chitinispirillum alkaliphilum]|nr:DUF1854 domain-containing protein [Chitinispirillum alkaliphilum]
MNQISLRKKNDQVFAVTDKGEEVEVTIVWARPSSGSNREISVLGSDGEIAFLEGLHHLDEFSRTVAMEELSVRYFKPKINKIIKTDVYIGNRYFHVETDSGVREFVIKNPYMDIKRVDEDGMQISDVAGNLYLIPSFAALDKKSKLHLEKVI